MQYLHAFLLGGAICALSQILIDKTKLTSARILAGYVVLGVVLTGLGIYQPLVEWGGAGATIPLLGFGYALANGAATGVAQQVQRHGGMYRRRRRHRCRYCIRLSVCPYLQACRQVKIADRASTVPSTLDEQCPKPRIHTRFRAFCCAKSGAQGTPFCEILCAPRAQNTVSTVQRQFVIF